MCSDAANEDVMLVRAFAIGIVFVLALFATPNAARAEDNIVTCVLDRSGVEFRGTCEIPCSVNALVIDIDGPNSKKACDLPSRNVQAALHETSDGNWLGTMQGRFAEDPTRLELVIGSGTKPNVAKTPFGWFLLQHAQREDETLRLRIPANNHLPPTQDDIRIIQRAMALMSDETAWNREDDRACPANPRKWSLFCALEQATREVSGGVHYRQPALQMVREVLNEVGGNRLGKHRLMDFNNHPDTTLAEIHGLLNTAQARLETRLR
jgi:hypothetical protein